jgi:hypothetical protein
LFSIQDLVIEALDGSRDPDTAAVISTWKSALAAKPSDPAFSALANSGSQRVRSVSILRGAAAAIIFSLLFSVGTFVSSVMLLVSPPEEKKTRRRYRYALYGMAIFGGLLFASAITLFILALMIGPGAFASSSSVGSSTPQVMLGYLFTLVGVVSRIVSVPVIAFVAVCILGIELVVIGFFIYLMLKIAGNCLKSREPTNAGMYTYYSYRW